MHTSPLRALLASVFLRTTATAPVYYPPNQYPLDGPDISPALQSKLDLAFQGPLYDYPTSFTQGIIPKGIHSHNDYWRPVPFYTALSVGAISTEADVWLRDGVLLVGHETQALTTSRTFESLYINPILDVLSKQNPKNPLIEGNGEKNGVFDTSSGQTLYLFVDVKTEGNETFEAVVKALEPLRSGGWLSSVDGENFTSGAVTVIGTGNTPPSHILPLQKRDYFYDAPIPSLSLPSITQYTSPIASYNFDTIFGQVNGTTLNTTQVEILRTQVTQAHEKGIKLRYWNQPEWPLAKRDGVWQQLLDEGVDFINADDVVAAAQLGG